MVLLALATSEKDLRERVGKIVVGYTKSGEPVTAEDLKVAGSMAVILRDALKPNLLQTIEGQPALVHTGPFGNIATGQSSIVADLIGIRTGDYLITEAGFGADIGAEKFFDMKCRLSGLTPSAAVVVATVRALKAHSGRHSIKPGQAAASRAARREPRRGRHRRRQPAQAPGEPQEVRHHAGRRDQRLPDRPPERARGHRRDRRGGRRPVRGRHARRRRWCRRRRAGPRRRGGRERAERLPVPLPARGHHREEDRDDRHRALRRDRRRLLPCRGCAGQEVPGARLRQPADRHRQDAPVHHQRRQPARRPGGLGPAARARAAAGGRGRLRLRRVRRDPHDARPVQPPGGRADRHRRGRQHRRPVVAGLRRRLVRMRRDDSSRRSTSSTIRARVGAVMPGVVDDLTRLVAIPSCAFPGFPAEPVLEMARETVELLRRSGLPDARLLEVPGGYPVVYAERPAPPGAPTVLLYAHYDVQPAPPEQGWTVDPWQPMVRDGRLYGRGAADDKSGIAMHAATLQAFGGRPPVGLQRGHRGRGGDRLPPRGLRARQPRAVHR